MIILIKNIFVVFVINISVQVVTFIFIVYMVLMKINIVTNAMTTIIIFKQILAEFKNNV
jgi:hypothetical protein